MSFGFGFSTKGNIGGGWNIRSTHPIMLIQENADGDMVDYIGLSIIDTRPGVAPYPAEKSISLVFPGTGYAELASAITVIGNFTIRFSAVNDGTTGIVLGDVGAVDFIYFYSKIGLRFKINNVNYSFVIPDSSTPSDYIFARTGSSLALSVNGTPITPQNIGTGDWHFSKIGANIFDGSGAANKITAKLWNINVEDSVGVKFTNSLGQGAGLLLLSTVGPNVTCTGTTWHSATNFGVSWNTTGYLEADGTGTYADGAKLPIGTVEAGSTKAGPFRNNLALNPKPKVIFTFDDGNYSDYNQAYAYLSTKGMVGTSFIISDKVGDVGYLSLANMTAMQAGGWEFGNHTDGTTNLTTLTHAQQLATITACRDWLIANGFSANASHIAYPQGDKNTDTDQIISELGLISGRGTTTALEQSSLVADAIDYYDLPVSGYLETLTLEQAQAVIDTAITNDQVCIFLIHTIGSGTPFNVTSFQALVDYAKTKIDAGLIENIGYCEWVNSLKNFNNAFDQSLFDFSIVPSYETYSIDDGTFYTGVDPNVFSLADMAAWTGPRHFYRDKIVAASYPSDLTGTDLIKAKRYFRITTQFEIMTDNSAIMYDNGHPMYEVINA